MDLHVDQVSVSTLDWFTLITAVLAIACLVCLRSKGPIEGHVVCGTPSKFRDFLSLLMDYRTFIGTILIITAASCLAYQAWHYFH